MSLTSSTEFLHSWCLNNPSKVFSLDKAYSPSQFGPEKLLGQSHSYPGDEMNGKHEPPCWHGLDWHGLLNTE